MTRRAFTLIELLVVIAIIAILAAILFPVFAKAREKARQSACSANVKQFSVAVMQYTQDYDEMLPFAFSGASGAPAFHVLLFPYTKSYQMGVCPSDASPASTNGQRLSYIANYAALKPGTVPSGTVSTQSLAGVEYPAQTIAIAERTSGGGYVGMHCNSGDLDRGAFERHNGGANYAFVDGHAKWLQASDAKKQSTYWLP